MLSSQWGTTMANEQKSTSDLDQPMVYQIRVKGYLGQQWIYWFEGLTITLEEDGITLLTGLVIDQAALHGILNKVRDLGLSLLSVKSDGIGLQNNKPVAYE